MLRRGELAALAAVQNNSCLSGGVEGTGMEQQLLFQAQEDSGGH